MSLRSIARCPGNGFIVLCSTLLLCYSVDMPRSAMAGYTTSLNVAANDSAHHRPSPDYSETIENKIAASASVGYDGRTSWYGTQFPVAATSSASFDLGPGALAFYVESIGYEASASASVQLEDTIYPVWEPGYSGVMEIQINWTITGDYTVYAWNANIGEWVVGGAPRNLGLSSTFYYRVDGGATVKSPAVYNQYNLTDGHESWTQMVYFDPGVNTSIDIGESAWCWLDSYNSQKAVADFSNTGLIELILPDGAAYTSDSGVFLTGVIIPAPGAVILSSIGMGLVGWLRRRRIL